MVDLSASIGELTLPHPLMTASGTYGYGTEALPFADPSTLAAIVGKSISLEPRPGNPPPRTVETPAGMINAIGLQNPGLQGFLQEKLPAMRELGVPVVVNLVGHSADEFRRLAEALADERGVVALELNVSCPNVDGGRDFGVDPVALENLVRTVKTTGPRPLWVKLTPLVTDITELAAAAEAGGADALVLANTWPALAVNWRREKSPITRGMGGLSGPAIRPLTLRLVHLVRQMTELPIIGCGGIASAEDVLEYIVTGASAVQLGTALFTDPALPEHVLNDLRQLLEAKGVQRLADLVRTLRL